MNLSIHQVKQEFSQWRSERLNPKEKIPEPLLESARRLLPLYSKSELGRILGINPQKLINEKENFSSFVPVELPFENSSPFCVRVQLGRREVQIDCQGEDLETLFSCLEGR